MAETLTNINIEGELKKNKIYFKKESNSIYGDWN